jgi:diaminohydroxyphosphoribosylaminopyrimidine deaminase/5-amino-6-(5-phosphoribosylamino)uracil reductase
LTARDLGSAESRSQADQRWMTRAIDLARHATGQTSPNPLVGAVIVRETPSGDVLLGEGFHRRAGLPHAEIEALTAAAAAGHDVRGATIYVTLEPCCHFGRTGPCTRALINAGIGRVVVAQTDPNPQVAGNGLAELQASNITVESGLLDAESRALNPAFNHWITTRRPHVTLKLATSLDGRIAAAPDTRTTVTGPTANLRVMELRRAADLTVRGPDSVLPLGPLRPRRGVLDTRLDLPEDLNVFAAPDAANLVVITAAAPDHPRAMSLAALGATLVHAPPDLPHHAAIDLSSALAQLGALSPRPITSILVEGGGRLAASLLSQHLVQRTILHVAPTFFGASAVPAVGRFLITPGRWHIVSTERLGPDLEIVLEPGAPPEPEPEPA